MSAPDSPRGAELSTAIAGVVVTVLGKRYVLEFKPDEERAYSFGSAIHADVRVLRPDVAPTQFYFERLPGGIQVVPGYARNAVLIDGRPLVGVTPLGKEHRMSVGVLDVALETFERRSGAPSDSGVSLAPRENDAVALRNPRTDRRRAALRSARELVDDDAPTLLAVRLDKRVAHGVRVDPGPLAPSSSEADASLGLPAVEPPCREAVKIARLGSRMMAATAERRRQLGYAEATTGGSSARLGADSTEQPGPRAVNVTSEGISQPISPGGAPPMAETILESDEIARAREAFAARMAARSIVAPCGTPELGDAPRKASGDVVLADLNAHAAPPPRVQARNQWPSFVTALLRPRRWAALHRTYLFVAGISLTGGVALVLVWSVWRSTNASPQGQETTDDGAARGNAIGSTEHTADRTVPDRIAGETLVRPTDAARISVPSAGVESAPATRLDVAGAATGSPRLHDVWNQARQNPTGAAARSEPSTSSLSLAALVELRAGRYSEAAARYATASAAQPESKPHLVLAQLMRRASSQRCRSATGQSLGACPEVQR